MWPGREREGGRVQSVRFSPDLLRHRYPQLTLALACGLIVLSSALLELWGGGGGTWANGNRIELPFS